MAIASGGRAFDAVASSSASSTSTNVNVKSPERPFPLATATVTTPGARAGETHSNTTVSPIDTVDAETGPIVPTWQTENRTDASTEGPA